MRIVKRIVLTILVLVAIALLAAALLPKDMTVERSVLINQPADSVFGYVKYLRNQNDFSKWAGMDPAMHKEFHGTDAQPGFVSRWESNQRDVGSGEQSIRAIDPASRRIDFAIHFFKPMDGTADAWMQANDKGGSSDVHWSITMHMKWPFNLMGVFFKGSVGNDLQTGLDNLKTRLEATH